MRTVAKKRGNKDDIENKQAGGEHDLKIMKINVDKDIGGGYKTPPTQNLSKLTPGTTTTRQQAGYGRKQTKISKRIAQYNNRCTNYW